MCYFFSLKQSLQQLGPLLNQSGVREFGLFIEDLLTMMPDVPKGDNNYTLSDFVQKTPVLQELFKAIELGPKVLDSLLNATITKPRELVKILMTGNVTEIFCSEKSLTELMSLPKTVNVSVITSSFCNFENKSMLDQFAITAGFSDFILGLADKSVNPDWVEIASNSEKMFTSFMEFVNKSSTFDVLKMSEAFYYANNTDDLWKLLSVFGALGELGNSTENNETMQFLHTVVEATDVMMGVFENFLDNVEANGNEFSLQSLFLNSSRAMELLNSVEGLDTKTISGLMVARMRPGMVGILFFTLVLLIKCILCMLANFSCICCCLLTFFFKSNFFKNYFRNMIRVSSSLDPDQYRHSVGPDLGPNCLQRLLADDKSCC